MQRTTTAIAGAIATVLALSVALPVMAQSADDQGAREDRRGQSEQGHGQRRDRQRLAEFLELYDTNADGDITQEEVDAVRAARLAEFDADQDGQLSLSEYEALWLNAMRERMVDRFQSHDDDGDGLVTVDEFGENFANLVERADRNDDGVLNADDQRRPGGARPDTETE
ncbi:hypothetical protein [Yoonia sp. BS5-3]|uniref:EF-hand domain-containing protein n=1 Tax=Yoonia phaeophyticola TaxID=3137369 RepID=A0ABZ2V3V2_9RHOB